MAIVTNVTNTAYVASNGSTGQISNRTVAHAATLMLLRATPYLVLEKFGQTYVLPNNSTKICRFRRIEALDATPAALTEAVTPSEAKPLSYSDVECTLVQHGDRMIVSDVVRDTCEDPILNQAAEVLGEQAAEMVENYRLGVVLGGTNVEYSNGTARNQVNTAPTLSVLRRIIRKLKNQKARQITSIVRSTPSFNTQNIAPSFVAICHPDLEADLRGLAGFVDIKDYGQLTPWENEIGSVEGIRFIYTTLMKPIANGGGAKGTMVSTGGTNADVYQTLILAKDAYGIVPLKGQAGITPRIINATPSDSDPFAQRTQIVWKTMHTCVILNQAWMVRLEHAVTAL